MPVLNKIVIIFLLTVTGYSLSAQTSCATAVNIPAIPYSTPPWSIIPFDPTPHTTCGSSNLYTSAHACGNSLMNREDYVYKFTPGAGNSCININLTGNGQPGLGVLDADGAVFVFDGCPNLATTTCVAQSVNMGAGTANINNLSLTPGTTYYIIVSGGTACFSYQLNLTPGVCGAPPPPVGATCLNPIEISSFPYSSGIVSTAGQMNDYNRGNTCNNPGMDGNDIVFHFKITGPTCLHYSLSNINTTVNMFISRGCPNIPGSVCVKQHSCSPTLCRAITEEMTLTVPGDYYIIVSRGVGGDVNFKLDIDTGSPDDNIACKTCNDEENCSSCKNVGFEKLSLNGWQGFTGFYNTPTALAGFMSGPFNNTLTRHTIMTKGNYDPLVPALSCVNPTGNDYSVRLGNSMYNQDQGGTGSGDSEALKFKFKVDSSNTNFIYSYAVVFEDPGHSAGDQPYFSIRMHTVGDNKEITCARYEVRAGPNIPGFKPVNGGTLLYKDWTTVNIPLLSYIGKEVIITFINKDCALDGHFGYSYIDAKCGRLEILREKDILCNEDSITLEAPEGFVNYKWNTGATTPVIVVSESGTYSVEMTTVTGCKVINEVYISKEEKPDIDFEFEFNCVDSTVTFTDKSQPGENSPIIGWYWTFGDGGTSTLQNPVHKYNLSGNYNVTLTLFTKNGCNSDTTITLPLDLFIPSGLLNALDTVRLCEKSKLSLRADSIPFTVYKWKGPAGFSSSARNPVIQSVTLSDTGWYYVTARIKDCIERIDSTYVIIEPLKQLSISPDTIICLGDSAQLFATGGVTYKWTPPLGLSSDVSRTPKASPPVTTKYKVFMTNDICPDTMLFVTVKVLSGNVALECPDTLRACEGDPVQLAANTTGFDTFLWRGPNNFTSTVPGPLIQQLTPADKGYYYLNASISNNDCITGFDSLYVDLHPNPVVNITPKPRELCYGDTILLKATGAATYTWKPDYKIINKNTATPKVFPFRDTTYTVTGTSSHGCKGKDSVLVVVKPLPVVNLGPDQLYCLGDSTLLDVTGQPYDSVLWSSGVKTTSIRVTNTGNYGITVWQRACKAIDNLNVNFQDPGAFNIGPDSTLCEGVIYNTKIDQSADSAIWNDGVRTLNRAITQSGTYSVIVYSGKCILTDTIIITFVPAPVIDLGKDSTVCIGSTVTLNAFEPLAIRYNWSTMETTPQITVSKTGIYWVEVYSIRCVITDTVLITVVDPPKLDLGPDKAICQGDSVRFSGNVNGDSYVWSTGAKTPAIWVKNPGAYTLTVVYGPCVISDVVNLSVQQPLPLWLGNDTTLCEDQPLIITAPGGFDSYQWSNNVMTPSIKPVTSGLYSLIARAGLCYSYDTIKVTFDTIPDFELGPDRTICLGTTTTLSSPIAANNYLWSTQETTRDITVSTAGLYSLYIQNNTCNYTDQLNVITVTPPQLYIGNDTTICDGASARFGQYIEGATYLWNTNETTPYIVTGDSGIYELTITYSVCQVKDAAELIVNLYPEPDLGPDSLVCEGTAVKLHANTIIGNKFAWNTHENLISITVNRAGTYWVVVSNGNCIASDTVFIRYQPQHFVKLPPDFELCSGEKYDIQSITDARNPSYYWNTQETTKDIVARNTGLYVLTVVDSVCTASDSVYATVHPLPYVKEQVYKLCPKDSLEFSLPEDYYYIFIANADTMDVRMLYPGTTLNFFVYDKNGCQSETHVTAILDMDCGDDIYVPNAFTPNGDGANDMFKVYSYDLTLHELHIFDRWGERVFFTKNPEIGWDGMYKNEKCKTEVYNWKLIYTNTYGTKKTVMGHVSLLK